MVSLVPSFSLDEQKVELVFLVDRSGSMGGGYYSGSPGGTIQVRTLSFSSLRNNHLTLQ